MSDEPEHNRAINRPPLFARGVGVFDANGVLMVNAATPKFAKQYVVAFNFLLAMNPTSSFCIAVPDGAGVSSSIIGEGASAEFLASVLDLAIERQDEYVAAVKSQQLIESLF